MQCLLPFVDDVVVASNVVASNVSSSKVFSTAVACCTRFMPAEKICEQRK